MKKRESDLRLEMCLKNFQDHKLSNRLKLNFLVEKLLGYQTKEEEEPRIDHNIDLYKNELKFKVLIGKDRGYTVGLMQGQHS